jgi:hypothetical protein
LRGLSAQALAAGGVIGPGEVLAVKVEFARLAGPAAIAAAATAALMTLYVFKNGGDPSALVCCGTNRAGAYPYEEIASPVGPNGHDGQFYYAIARDPWRRHNGERIDNPAARHQRLLYPAVCWLVTGGDPDRLLWAMPVINVLSVTALTAVGAWLAVRYGRSPWWGLLLPVALNVGLPALHDMNDPPATLAIVGLLAAWLTGGPAWLIGICAATALFGREQNLAIVAILGLQGLWQRRMADTLALAFGVLLWTGWVGILWHGYGEWPFFVRSNFSSPLEGMRFRWAHPGGNDGFSRRLAIIQVTSMLHLTFQVGLSGYLALRREWSVVTACMLAGAALALLISDGVYRDFWSYTRVFTWLPFGIWQLGVSGRSRWEMLSLSPAVLWPVVGALRYV